MYLSNLNQLYVGGRNTRGQLGQPITGVPISPPVLVNITNDVIAIACGSEHGIIQTNDSLVWTAGLATNGRLCRVAYESVFSSPVWTPINITNSISLFKKISGGERESMFLGTNGEIWGCGRNEYGVLGLGHTSTTYFATKSPNLVNITDFALGTDHALFLDFNFTVWVSGLNSGGQLGVFGGNVLLPLVNPALRNIGNIVQIAAGDVHSMFLTQAGDVYTCGGNSLGELGLSRYGQQTIPTKIQDLENIVAISSVRSYAFTVNICPNTSYSGGKCQYPVCNGLPSTDLAVCSGVGRCIAPETCECFTRTTIPSRYCEFKEYHWRGLQNGVWNDPRNWLVSISNQFIDSMDYPRQIGDLVIIDAIRNQAVPEITVRIETNINIHGIQLISRSGTNVTLLVPSRTSFQTNITILNSLNIGHNCRFVSNQAIINIFGHVNGHFEAIKCVITGVITFATDSQVFLTDAEISSATITMAGSMNAIGISFMDHSLLTCSGFCDFGVSSFLVRFGPSKVINTGTMNFRGQATIHHDFTLQNSGNLVVETFQSTIKHVFTTTGSTTRFAGNIVYDTFNVTGGSIILNGTMNGTFLFDSHDGSLCFADSLIHNGNMTLGKQGIVFFDVSSAGKWKKFITINGTLTMNSLLLIELKDGYSPNMNEVIYFMKADSLQTSPRIFLLGAPFKNAILLTKNQDISFAIVTSIGNIAETGYQCTYLGNRRSLEWIPIENRYMLSFTTPQGASTLGFGFDVNGTLDGSLLVSISPQGSVSKFIHNNTTSSIDYIIAIATQSQTIFGGLRPGYPIGKQYRTLNLLVAKELFEKQKYIYYGETQENSTGSHFNVPYSFSLVNSELVNCTNFLQPIRAEVYDYAAMAIVMLFYIIIFILCIVFSR